MKEVVKQADLNILKRSKEDPSTQGMGTTIVMAWLLGDKAYVCWCGDSRCYVLNKRNGLIQLSKDHSYVQELVDKGELSPELMHDHPLSNVITRCLGDVDNRAIPETRIYQLHNGDIIMLCSDGLCGLCHDDMILDVMIKYHEDPMECKNELISAALSSGGYDNVTVAIANIEIDEAEDVEEDTNSKEEDEKGESVTEGESEEELSSTIRTEVIGRRSHKFRNLMLIILLLIIAAGAYIYLSKDCETLRQSISTAVAPLWDKLIGYFNR
jgi:protein phosphatase